MMAMATALERNKTLQLVDFYDNQLGNTRRHDVAVTTLMHSLEKNSTLSELNLGNNDIGKDASPHNMNLFCFVCLSL